jgi:outer membrane protein TolC
MKHAIFSCGLAVIFASALRAITLDAAMDKTLQSNPAIQQAKLELEKAAGQRLVLRSISYPEANLKGIAGAEGGRRIELSDETKAFGFAQGNFAQALFNAAIPPSRRRGDIELLLAQQRLNVAVVEQLHKTRIAFYTALYNRSLETLLESQRERLEANIATQEARYEAGTTERRSLTSVRLQAHELAPQIETARHTRSAALLDLAEAMGSNLGPGAALPEPDGELHFVPDYPNAARETTTALERRADLKLARLLIRAADEEKRIVQADYYPVVRAIVAGDYIPVSGIRRGGQGSPSRSDDFISSEVRAGAAYNWRVIDNGKVGGAVLRQREAREINRELLSKLEMNVPRELTRIENILRAIDAQYESLSKAADVAQQNVGLLRENMKQGLASQLEYRDAEESLLETRDRLLNAIYQQNMARAEWDLATGRYFQFSDDTATNVH